MRKGILICEDLLLSDIGVVFYCWLMLLSNYMLLLLLYFKVGLRELIGEFGFFFIFKIFAKKYVLMFKII